MGKVPVLLGALVMLSGCASIMKGSSQSINITTPPTTGATCTLTSKEGTWQLTSPGSVTVEKSQEDIQARCTKPGWLDASAVIPSNFQGWTVGNLLIGGVIGLGVDAATGAIHEYPNAFQIPMFPAAAAASAPPPVAAQPTRATVPPSKGKPGV